jgi:hypothetical protein
MANLEDRGRRPEEKFREGFSSEAGCRAATRRSSGLRLLCLVGTLALTVICSAGTPVAARGRDATLPTLPGGGLPGDVYTNGPNNVNVDNGASAQVVAQVNVPAGNYVVHVSMSVANGNASLFGCQLAGSSMLFPMFVPPLGASPFGSVFPILVTLSFTDIASLSSNGTITVTCQNNGPGQPVFVNVRLMAILGGTLHQQ